jgi:hypothetical protein
MDILIVEFFFFFFFLSSPLPHESKYIHDLESYVVMVFCATRIWFWFLS